MATPIPRNTVPWNVEDIVRITGGHIWAEHAGKVQGVSTDSRTLSRGNLFIALEGPQTDGHAHLKAALKAGANAVLVTEGKKAPKGITVIEVPDTLTALGDLAAWHRRAWGGYVVAITGSVGKTLAKELAAPVLQVMYRHVLHSQGNLNNLVGLPMSLLQLRAEHRVAVVELGVSQLGEMARLADIAKPDAALVTRVALAHTEGLVSLEQVAEEKAQLFASLSSKGLAIINADDPMSPILLKHVPTQRLIRFGLHPEADVQLLEHHIDSDLRSGCKLRLQDLAEPMQLHMRILGEAGAMAAAAVVALVMGMIKVSQPAAIGNALSAAQRVLNELPALPQRLQLKSGINDSLIIDDTYNANPASVRMGLETAAEVARVLGGRLIVVLGDMKELGSASRDEHRQVGRQIVATSAAVFVGCGPEMRYALEAASETTSLASPTAGIHVGQAKDAVKPVAELLQARDVVLVKGSRSMAMEQVVDGLIAPLEAA